MRFSVSSSVVLTAVTLSSYVVAAPVAVRPHTAIYHSPGYARDASNTISEAQPGALSGRFHGRPIPRYYRDDNAESFASASTAPATDAASPKDGGDADAPVTAEGLLSGIPIAGPLLDTVGGAAGSVLGPVTGVLSGLLKPVEQLVGGLPILGGLLGPLLGDVDGLVSSLPGQLAGILDVPADGATSSTAAGPTATSDRQALRQSQEAALKMLTAVLEIASHELPMTGAAAMALPLSDASSAMLESPIDTIASSAFSSTSALAEQTPAAAV